MTAQVLVPLDDSEVAEAALRFALEIHSDADITALHVVGEASSMMGEAAGIALSDDPDAAAKKHSEPIFETARAIAAEYDAEITTVTAIGSPAKTIVDHSEDFDVVVIGSHGGSLADRLFVGNVTQRVLRGSPVPVTVVR